MRTPLVPILVLWPLVVPSAGRAQAPTVLLREGAVVAPGLTVTRINRNDTNRLGGYVTLGVASDPGGEKVSFAWGSVDGQQAPGVLWMEGDYAGYLQTGWLLTAAMDDLGRIAYLADVQVDRLSVWRDDVPIAVQHEPATVVGIWGNLSDVGTTDAGDPWFQDPKGLFFGTAAAPFYLVGDPLPGTADTIGWVREAQFSSGAEHHLVTMNRVTQAGNELFVLDGAPVTVGGFELETDTILPPQLEGNGVDLYDAVDSVDVNVDGSWCAAVRRVYAGGARADEILRDGQILYTGDDVLDGVVLTDVDGRVQVSDRGELLHVWGTPLPFAGADAALFVGDDRIVGAGDAVDLDGDGTVDPEATLLPAFGNESWDATLSEDGWVYFSADVQLVQPGGTTVHDAFLRVPRAPAPISYCTPKPSSSGCAAVLRTSDPSLAPVAGAGGYALLATSVEGQRNGLFFWGTSGPVAVPFLGGTLCVLPPLQRGPIQTSGGTPNTCSGGFALELNAGDPWDLGPGQTVWWQAWYRDPALGDGFDVALSNAIEVQAR